MMRLESRLDSWKSIHEDTANAVEDFSPHGQKVTPLELLQGVKEHELTHRQQLFVYLRLKGIVPPTTGRRQAKANG